MPRIRNSSDLIEVGNLIKNRRNELNMSQETLGEVIEVSGNTIHRIESAIVSTGIDKLIQISDALHTSPNALLPSRFIEGKEEHELRIHTITKIWQRLNHGNRKMAYSVILPLLNGLFEQQH